MNRIKWLSFISLFLMISVTFTFNSPLINDSYSVSKNDSEDTEEGDSNSSTDSKDGEESSGTTDSTEEDDPALYADTEIGKAISVLSEIEPKEVTKGVLGYTVKIKKDDFDKIKKSLGGTETTGTTFKTKSRYYNLLAAEGDANDADTTTNADSAADATPSTSSALTKDKVKELDEEYKVIKDDKVKLAYVLKHKLMHTSLAKMDDNKKKLFHDAFKKIKRLLGYIDWDYINALEKVDADLSDADKTMLGAYGLVKAAVPVVTGLTTYYNGLADMSPYPEIAAAMTDTYAEVFKDEAKLKKYKDQVKKLYEAYKKILDANVMVKTTVFETGKDIEVKVYLSTGIEGLEFDALDGFLNKAKIAGLEIGIDTTLGTGVLNAMKVLADHGLVVAKLKVDTGKGNDLLKSTVMKAISTFTDLTAAPAAGSYLEEIVNTLAPTEVTGVTRTNDFTATQVLVAPKATDTLVDSYPIDRANANAVSIATADLAIQTISVKMHNGSPYVYIIYKTSTVGNATIAQQIGITNIAGTGTDIVTFKTTNIKTLAGNAVTFDTATALTDTPTYGSEVTCAAANLNTLKTCFSNNGKLVLTTLPFDFFAPATVASAVITFGHSLDYLVLLKKFAMSYVTVMGTMPEDSTMGLINKAIPSASKTDYQELTEVDTNFVATTKHASYTGAYGADDATKKKTIVLSLKKFKKN